MNKDKLIKELKLQNRKLKQWVWWQWGAYLFLVLAFFIHMTINT